MAIKYTIPFKSLRSGTLYSVNIYDASYSGSPVVLKGGAQPFVTQEDDNDDFFADIRTQSGSLRIVDDGKDANGNALPAPHPLAYLRGPTGSTARETPAPAGFHIILH